MAQVSMTVNIDAQMKQRIDEFCSISGSSQEETFAEMMHMWERLVYIPWSEFFKKENARREGVVAFKRIRKMAEEGELPELTLDEINEEIAAARAERRAREARS